MRTPIESVVFLSFLVDTPLSESRYAEILEGWVDEEREAHDDHHDILKQLDELDDHGEPFSEEEDHDDTSNENDDTQESEEEAPADKEEVDEGIPDDNSVEEVEPDTAEEDAEQDETDDNDNEVIFRFICSISGTRHLKFFIFFAGGRGQQKRGG